MASENIDLSLVPWGQQVSHMTAGYLQCLLSLALSNHSTLHWSLVGLRLDFSYTDRCKGVFSPLLARAYTASSNNTEENKCNRGRVCMLVFVTVCVSVFAHESRRESETYKGRQTVCRTNEFQANVCYEWASGGHSSPDSSMNCLTNKTVLLDPHLIEGKVGIIKRPITVAFFH